MSRLVDWFDRRFYPACGGNWDNQLFRERILAHLLPGHVVLDLGAGAGFVKQMDFRGTAARVCGVDLDPRVAENPMLDEAYVAAADDLPYAEASFDLVFADNVMEHLADPTSVFREVRRVLKSDGIFLFKTPNKAHYIPTIARITPHGAHQHLNRLRGRAEVDTFPTHYRVNSDGVIRGLAAQTGFRVGKIDRIEGRPEYLRFSAASYAVGLAYERIVNASDLFAPFRILLVAELIKSAESDPANVAS